MTTPDPAAPHEPIAAHSAGVPVAGAVPAPMSDRKPDAISGAQAPLGCARGVLQRLTAQQTWSPDTRLVVLVALTCVLMLEIMIAAVFWTDYAPYAGIPISPTVGFTCTLLAGLMASVPILMLMRRLRRGRPRLAGR